MNLVEILEKEAKQQRKELNDAEVISDVNRLLAEQTAADRQILRDMGIKDYSAIKKEKIRAKKFELEAHSNQYDNIFHIDEIKRIAMKYNLRFLKTDYYKGTIDSELATKVREFVKENDINQSRLQYNFYILAPESCFKLENRPKPVDPVMFYKIDADHYALVHQWGGDLSFKNRVLGWYYKDWYNFTAGNLLMTLPIPHMVALFFGGMNAAFMTTMIFSVITAALSIFISQDNARDLFTEHTWDSPYKD